MSRLRPWGGGAGDGVAYASGVTLRQHWSDAAVSHHVTLRSSVLVLRLSVFAHRGLWWMGGGLNQCVDVVQLRVNADRSS